MNLNQDLSTGDMHGFYGKTQRKRIVRDANAHFEIHITLVETADFCLAIQFRNIHTEPLVLPFSNRTRKAEQIGFMLFNKGKRLEARGNIHILPSPADESPFPVVDAGASFTYHLRGTIDGDILCFPGCCYDLTKGDTYVIQFHYMAHRSNEILWRF